MKIMVTSLKRSQACTATASAPNFSAGHHLPTPSLETPGHSQVSLGQSLLGSLLLSPESWCTRFCCVLQESISYNFPKFEFRIKPCFHQRYSEGSNKPCVHQGPRDHTESERRLRRYRVSTGLPQGQEIWVQQTWVWHKPS